jgi:tRNA-specific 2-thiouridylase
MKVLLAMSGGIDSSVVAHLLKEQGHEVIGVRFTLWTDPLAPAIAQILPTKCCTTQNISRANNVAKKLGIPLHIISLENEFKETVVDPFLEGHKQGLTPNPCIGCNRNIKFGKLLNLTKELGCDMLATGHYARTAIENMSDGTSRMLLLESVDKKKDQSYYLYGLTQEQLRVVTFPLGGMLKSEVYALAENFGVPLPDSYRESQDLCFFPEKTPEEFLKRHLKSDLRPGEIIRRDGTVVGSHLGLPLYTVGQRQGLKIGGLKVPLEVVEKDAHTNRLIVAEKDTERITSVKLADVRFVSWIPETNIALPIDCRLRSLSARKHGALKVTGNEGIFEFSTLQSPQAPGQSLVLYRGEEVVGGGVMQ